MTRPLPVLFGLLTLLAATPAPAALQATEWRTARPITLPSLSRPGWVYLPLDAEALAVDSLSEYRLVARGGREIPYRMLVSSGQVETRTLPATLVSEARSATQAQRVLDLGEPPVQANRLALQLRGDNFRCRALLEGSTDASQWWTLSTDGLVYRHEGRFEQLTLTLPPSNYRYLRVTLTRLQGTLPIVEGAQLVSRIALPQKLVPVPVTLTRREDRKAQLSLLDLRVARLTRDTAQIRFEVAEPRFSREVRIKGSEQNDAAQFFTYQTLERTVPGKEAALSWSLPPFRSLHLAIANGDDPPLTIRSLEVFRAERGLLFSADPAQQYQLWYGRENTPEPQYDLERLPLPAALASLPLASLGPAQALPRKPPPPTPWSEKHPAIFWAALGLALLLLALLIYRGLRAMPRTAERSGDG